MQLNNVNEQTVVTLLVCFEFLVFEYFQFFQHYLKRQCLISSNEMFCKALVKTRLCSSGVLMLCGNEG